MQIITKEDAKAAGLNKFFTGVKCPKGHLDQRYVCDSKCVTCSKEFQKSRPRETVRSCSRKHYHSAKNREWQKENRERLKEYFEDWKSKNQGKLNHLKTLYKKRVRMATPKWLTKEQKKEIENFYILRKEDEHVDHIVPLKGRNVCGLHVPWNLQIISAQENMRKSNRF